MPVKKKRSSRIKSGNRTAIDEDLPTLDPVATLISGVQTPDANSTKPKSKKKKLSKAEKALAKVDKAAEGLKSSGQPFLNFVDRMDRWLTRNATKAVDLFRKADQSGEGVITYEEFKAGMLDLNIPCSAVELHLLAKLFDQNDLEEIEYLDVAKGMACVREREADYRQQDIRPQLVLTKRDFPHCPTCKMAVWDGESYRETIPRYIEVLFRLITFDGYKDHPGHFNKVVHSHISVYGLAQIIKEETCINTTKLAIFTEKSYDKQCLLPVEKSLEDLGFQGGPVDNPEELLLYYDYKVEFTDCPLLTSDHYFGQKLEHL